MKADPDASMDKLLASTLKAGRAETRRAMPADAHIDAETLAAWTDGALDARERAAAEAHAAGCARCQQLLAAMVRTQPASEVPKSPWRMPSLAWLVPLTAAATALAIWVAVPRPSRVQVSTGETTVDELAPAARSGRSLPPPPDEPAATTRDQIARPDEPRRPAALQKSAPGLTESDSANRVPPKASAFLKDTKQESVEAKATTPTIAESANVAPATPAAGGAAAAPALPPASARAVPRAAAEAGARMETAAAPSRMAFAAGLDVIVVSSNPSTRFRLLPGGGVQRSADGGSTWRTEVTGATDTLRGGSSPSPSVCWLIGRAGMVLLSIDGRTWRRITFPETVDLLSIVATDQDSATVTTADGRSFVTVDGGQTWTLRPGL